MKVNFGQQIVDLDEKEVGMTLGGAVIQAMLSTVQGDDRLTANDKIKMFELALKVKDSEKTDGEASLTVEEAAFVKERIGKIYNVLVVGRVFQMIEADGEEEKGEKKKK